MNCRVRGNNINNKKFILKEIMFGLARTIVLARLLAPNDFGSYGVGLVNTVQMLRRTM